VGINSCVKTPDRLVGELVREPGQVLGRQEEQGVLVEQLQELGVQLEAVLDEFDFFVLLQIVGEEIRELLQVVGLQPLAGLDEHHQIVDGAEVLQSVLEGVDRLVALGNQRQHVRFQLEPRAEPGADEHGEQGQDENQLVPASAEPLHPEQKTALAAQRWAMGWNGTHAGGTPR
jgi:hypothetical protein